MQKTQNSRRMICKYARIAENGSSSSSSNNLLAHILDPIGSLVSTSYIVGGWVVGHTFSKLVNFEFCSVVMMEC